VDPPSFYGGSEGIMTILTDLVRPIDAVIVESSS
jgi:hypothetical protein